MMSSWPAISAFAWRDFFRRITAHHAASTRAASKTCDETVVSWDLSYGCAVTSRQSVHSLGVNEEVSIISYYGPPPCYDAPGSRTTQSACC